MRDIWDRIHQGLLVHAPEIVSLLQPGALVEEIRNTEAILGVAFPQDVRESYQIHNGMSRLQSFRYDWPEFYSLREIVIQWDCWKNLLESGEFFEEKSTPKGPIKTDWWNIKWIPLWGNRGGDHCCLDLDPPPEGQLGQMITMWHEIGAEEVLAPSFKDLLASFADQLNAGAYTFSTEYGLITLSELEELQSPDKENERQLARFITRYADNPAEMQAKLKQQLLSTSHDGSLSDLEESMLKALEDSIPQAFNKDELIEPNE